MVLGTLLDKNLSESMLAFETSFPREIILLLHTYFTWTCKSSPRLLQTIWQKRSMIKVCLEGGLESGRAAYPTPYILEMVTSKVT